MVWRWKYVTVDSCKHCKWKKDQFVLSNRWNTGVSKNIILSSSFGYSGKKLLCVYKNWKFWKIIWISTSAQSCLGCLFTDNGKLWSQIFFLIIQSDRSLFLNVIHGQTTENTRCVDILDTTRLKNNRFDSFSSSILSKFFNIICKNFVSEINSNIHALHQKKRRKKDDKPSKQSAKIKTLQSEKWL